MLNSLKKLYTIGTQSIYRVSLNSSSKRFISQELNDFLSVIKTQKQVTPNQYLEALKICNTKEDIPTTFYLLNQFEKNFHHVNPRILVQLSQVYQNCGYQNTSDFITKSLQSHVKLSTSDLITPCLSDIKASYNVNQAYSLIQTLMDMKIQFPATLFPVLYSFTKDKSFQQHLLSIVQYILVYRSKRLSMVRMILNINTRKMCLFSSSTAVDICQTAKT